jgi:hypothetical protein
VGHLHSPGRSLTSGNGGLGGAAIGAGWRFPTLKPGSFIWRTLGCRENLSSPAFLARSIFPMTTPREIPSSAPISDKDLFCVQSAAMSSRLTTAPSASAAACAVAHRPMPVAPPLHRTRDARAQPATCARNRRSIGGAVSSGTWEIERASLRLVVRLRHCAPNKADSKGADNGLPKGVSSSHTL